MFWPADMDRFVMRYISGHMPIFRETNTGEHGRSLLSSEVPGLSSDPIYPKTFGYHVLSMPSLTIN